jgi:hypothetical protein
VVVKYAGGSGVGVTLTLTKKLEVFKNAAGSQADCEKCAVLLFYRQFI